MAKTIRAVALAICIACSLLDKCTTDITDQSTVDTTLFTSPDVQLITSTLSLDYSLRPIQTLPLTTENTNKESSTDNPFTQNNQSDNHSIDSIISISSFTNAELTSSFFSEAVTPSTPLSTYDADDEVSGNMHYMQTPVLNSSFLPSENLDPQTYFKTKSLQSENSENNYTSLNLTRESTLFLEPTTIKYNSFQNSDEPISSNNPIDQDEVTKTTVNETENIESNEGEVFKVPRMGKELTISAQDKTVIAEVSATTTSVSSEMMHSTNLPEIESNILAIESKKTIVDDIANIASSSQNQSSDSSVSFINNKDLVLTGIEEKVHENASDNLSNTKNIVLILKKDCAGVNIFQNMFAVLNTHLMGLLSSVSGQNTNINTVNCDAFFHLKLSIDSATDHVLKEVAHILLSNITLGEDLKVEKVFLNSDEYDKFSSISETSNDDGLFIKREIIAYIVAGICLGLFIGTLTACCCARLFCKKQTNSLDLCDIPHLNPKLEDYKLTPIPRPTISFPEYGRELFNPAYNDTAPRIEDTILNQHHFSGDTTNSMAKDSGSHSREMRTFGGKKPCSRVQSLDVRPNMRGGNGWISNSTEKLNTDFDKKSGFDNSGFRKWF